MKKKVSKKIHKQCWNLNTEFLNWLRKRLPVYLEDAGEFVDLTFHKWEYKGELLTQEQLIQRMIKNLELEEKYYEFDTQCDVAVKEILEIWSLIFHAMWW